MCKRKGGTLSLTLKPKMTQLCQFLLDCGLFSSFQFMAVLCYAEATGYMQRICSKGDETDLCQNIKDEVKPSAAEYLPYTPI